jgi:membrane-associated phospholipid phosphatase
MIPALLFVVFGFAVMLYFDYGDEILVLNPLRAEPLNTFFRFITRLGEPITFIVLGIIAALFRFRYTLLITLTGLSTMAYVNVFKDVVGSERPIWYFELTGKIDQVILVPGAYMNRGYTSFPSGHTMGAFALFSLVALFTARKYPLVGLAAIWTAILVGCSRIFLVQHFMLDVMGGLVCGLLMSDFWWQINRRFMGQWRWLDYGIWSFFKKK